MLGWVGLSIMCEFEMFFLNKFLRVCSNVEFFWVCVVIVCDEVILKFFL